MNLINTTTLEYPRSLWQLRQEHPNVSFPPDPTDEDLAPFDHANVHPTPQPTDYDARTERVEEAAPQSRTTTTTPAEPYINDFFEEVTPESVSVTTRHQAWEIRSATADEIAAYDAASAPQPDWMGFGVALAMDPTVAQLFTSVPTPISQALSIGLAKAGDGDPRLFTEIWSRISATEAVSAELLVQIGQLATQYHLPAEFIAKLG